MRKLTLIIPLVILIILLLFCGKNPAGGELLNTYDADSITVQLSGVNIVAHEIMDVKIDEYGGQIHITGLFKYYKDVGGQQESTDYNLDDWYKIEKVYLGNEVTITGSSIYVKIVDNQRSMILQIYGKL